MNEWAANTEAILNAETPRIYCLLIFKFAITHHSSDRPSVFKKKKKNEDQAIEAVEDLPSFHESVCRVFIQSEAESSLLNCLWGVICSDVQILVQICE